MKHNVKAQRAWYGNSGSGGGGGGGCCYELTTVAALQALVASNTLVQGTFYQITDVTANWQVVVLAESTNELSTQGQGIYQNALYTEAWYDLNTNTLLKIYDPLYQNTVEGTTILTFPWNFANYTGNYIDSSSTVVAFPLLVNDFNDNQIIDGSTCDFTNCTLGLFRANTVSSGSYLSLQTVTMVDFVNNTLENSSSIQLDNSTIGGSISQNTWSDGVSLLWQNSNITGNVFYNEIYGTTWFNSGATIGAITNNKIKSSALNTSSASINNNFSYNLFSDSSVILISTIADNINSNSLGGNSTLNLSNATILECNENTLYGSSNLTFFYVSPSCNILQNSLTSEGEILFNQNIAVNISDVRFNVITDSSLQYTSGTISGTLTVTQNTVVSDAVVIIGAAVNNILIDETFITGGVILVSNVDNTTLTRCHVFNAQIIASNGVICSFTQCTVTNESLLRVRDNTINIILQYNTLEDESIWDIATTSQIAGGFVYANNNHISGKSSVLFDGAFVTQFGGGPIYPANSGNVISAGAIVYLQSGTISEQFTGNVIEGNTSQVIFSNSEVNRCEGNIIQSSQLWITNSSYSTFNNAAISYNNLSGQSFINVTGNAQGIGWTNNTLTSGSVITTTLNDVVNMSWNELQSGQITVVNSVAAQDINYNVVTNGSYIYVDGVIAGTIDILYNTLTNLSYIDTTNATGFSPITKNTITDESYINLSNATWINGVSYNVIQGGSAIDASGTIRRIIGNSMDTQSYMNLSNITLNDRVSYNTLNSFSTLLAGNSTISTIQENNLTSGSIIDANGATLDSVSNNNLYSSGEIELRCINANGSILNNTVGNSSLMTLGGAVASTFITIEDNGVTDFSFFRDNNLGGVNITTIKGNTITSYGTILINQCTGTNFLGNIVTAGTMSLTSCTSVTTNFNHVMRANMTLGNTAVLGTVRSNHIVGPSSGTFGNLTVYGPVTMTTLEGNNIFNAGRIEVINTIPTSFQAIDWNLVANTSAVTFANCNAGRFGGAIIGDKGGNVIDNGSVLAFSGSTISVITNNTYKACVLSSTNDVTVNMRNNFLSSTQLTTNASTVTMNDNSITTGSILSFTAATVLTMNGNQVSDSFITYIGSTGTLFDNVLSSEANISITSGSGTLRYNYIKSSLVSFTSVGDTFDVRFNTIDQSLLSTGATTTIGNFHYNTLLSESQVVYAGGFGGTETVANNYLFKSSLDFQNPLKAYPIVSQNTLTNSTVVLQGGGSTTFDHNQVLNSTINSLGNVDNFSFNDLSAQSSISVGVTDIFTNLQYNKLVNADIVTDDTVNRPVDILDNNLSYAVLQLTNGTNINSIRYNTLLNNSTAIFNGNGGMDFLNNYLDSANTTVSNTLNQIYNQFYNATIALQNSGELNQCMIRNLSGTIETNHAQEVANPFNTSTFLYFLNCNDPAVLNAGNLTLTIEQGAFGGVFLCFGVPAGVNDVDNIVNFTSQGWICTFYWDSGVGSLRFRNGVGTVVLKSSSPANIVLDSQPEYVQFQDWFGSGNQYEIDHASY